MDARSPSFVGRSHEVDVVIELLQQARLVTITGPGGVGKSRLALRAAATQRAAYPDGIWLAELARLSDGSLVSAALLDVVAPHSRVETTELEALIRVLANMHGLLVIDNCEHVLEDAATAVAAIVRDCPATSVLATSREPLSLTGERVLRLLPLTQPTDGDDPSQVRDSDAATLLVERATQAGADVIIDDATAPVLSRICRLLDGLPLAIELCSSWLRDISLDELASRLVHQLPVLTRASRDTDPRHRTMAAALDWSYALLTTEEQAAFRGLSVFIGGFTLEAARAVVGADADVERLVERSLVQFDHSSGRYRMLEPVRQYAAAQLASAGDTPEIEHRHTQWIMELAEQANRLFTTDRPSWITRLGDERGNIGAVMERTLPKPDDPTPLRLVGALGTFWFTTGEAFAPEWIKSALSGTRRASDGTLARARVAAGMIYQQSQRYGDAAALLDLAVSYYRAADGPAGLAWSLFWLGRSRAKASPETRQKVEPLFTEARELFRRIDDRVGEGWANIWLGILLQHQGRMAEAATLFTEVAETAATSDPGGDAFRELANLYFESGDPDRARHYAERAVEYYSASGDIWEVCGALTTVALIQAGSGQVEASIQSLRQSRELALRHGFDDQLGHVLFTVVLLSAGFQELESAAALSASGLATPVWMQRKDNQLNRHTANVLSGPELAHARQRGASLNRTDTLKLAEEMLANLERRLALS